MVSIASLAKENTAQREEISSLKTQINIANDRAKHFDERAKHFESEYEKVIQAIKQAQREKFGRTSERFVDDGTQPQPLFPELTPVGSLPGNDEQEIEKITYTRKKPGSRKPDLENLPTREVIIPVPAEDRVCACGCEKKVIRYEQKEKLNFIPAIFEMVIEKREVVACPKNCGSELAIQTAPAPKAILPKARVSESLLAHIAVSKVLDRQPLYHLEKKFERQFHWRIPRQTMGRWLIQLADPLMPLVNLLRDAIRGYDVAYADGTSLQVLNEPARAPGKKNEAYCLRGGSPGKEVTLYEYNGYSDKEFLTEFFTEFEGTVHTDAENVFQSVAVLPNVRLSLCHAHARRKFEHVYTAVKKKDGLAKQALRFWQALYAIERDAKERDLVHPQVYELRQAKSVPLLAEFKAWLDHHGQTVLPKSPLGKAFAYSRKHWDGLCVYPTDGRLEIDNNATERDIKPFVIARKNFLFAATEAGADALGVHFSLILTAKRHGLNPFDYYKTILQKIPFCKTHADYEALLPWNLKP
jgi:transposase